MRGTRGLIILIALLATVGCVDNKPEVTVQDIESGWTNQSIINATFRACDDQDPSLDCEIKIINTLGNTTTYNLSNVPCEPRTIELNLFEGHNIINLCCIDSAGNQGCAETINLSVDSDSPVVEWLGFPG